MSQTIDEKVVALRFNNKQFQQGVQSTLDDVERLNKGLELKGASKGLEKVAEVSKNVDMSKMEKSLDRVKAKIGTLQTMYLTAVNRMTNAVIDFSKKTIDMFAIHPVTTGLNEYELKMGAVQTIMASTGESVQTINKYLDELNEYSDRTIYSFQDMTSNIGKFTNAGVDLKTAVNAIKGVSNAAALAGANAEQASHAMYNFAQGISTGFINVRDWTSIEVAGLNTTRFNKELLETAKEVGTVTETIDGMYQVITTNGSGSGMKTAINETKGFRDSLQYQWLTTEVLTKTLEKYASEEEKVGIEAYAAAQDVKTFSMMVDTLQEAAQSGWAQTWQLIVGDFEEAKELWTKTKDVFEGIISASADARNNLIGNAMKLQNAEGITGRQALWQSLLNILLYVRDVIGAIKDGFFDIFPPITDQKLRLMIENLLNFTKQLQNSDEKLQKIRATFRGIFAILDIGVTTIRFIGRVTIKTIKAVVNVLETVLFAGFALLMRWIDKIKSSDTGFNGWLNRIGKGFVKFAQHIRSLDGLTLDNVISTLKSFGKNVLGSMFDFSWVGETFANLRKTVSDSLKAAGIELGNVFGNWINTIAVQTGESETLFGKFLGVVKFFGVTLLNILKSLGQNLSLDEFTFGKVVALLITTSLLFIIVNVSKLLGKLAGLADRLDEVLGQFSKAIKAFGQKMKAESLFTISKSILVLTGALIALSLIDPEKLSSALIALGLIAAGLVGVSFALSKIGKAKDMLSLGAIILSMAASIKVLSSTMTMLAKMENIDVKQPLKLIAILAAGLIVAIKLLGSVKEKHYAGIFSTIAFVISLRMLVGLLKTITDMNLKGISSGLKTMLGLVGILMLSGTKLGNVSMGAAAMIASMAISLRLTIGPIKKLGEIDTDTINSGVLSIVKIFAAFALLIVPISIFSNNSSMFEAESEKGKKRIKKASSNIKDIGSAILKMSASLLVIAVAIKAFSKFEPEELSRATSIVGKILLLFAAIVVASKFAGEHASNAGSMLLKMSVSLVAIVGLISLLSLFKDVSILTGPMRVIEELLAVMAAILLVSKFAGATEHTAKTISAVTKAVVAISVVLVALTFIKREALQHAAYSMGLVLTTFGLIVAASALVPKNTKGIGLLTIAVVAIGGVLTALSLLPVNNVLQNAGALGIIMTALAASMFIISNSKSGIKNKDLLKKLGMYVAALGLLSLILELMNSMKVQNAIENAAGLTILMMSMSAAMWVIGKTDKIGLNVIGKIGLYAAIITAIQVILSVLNKFDINSSISDVANLSLLAIALSSAFYILSQSKTVEWKTVLQLGTILGAIGIVTGIMNWLKVSDFPLSIQGAASLGILLSTITASLLVLDKVKDIKKEAILAVAGMGLVMGELGFIMGLLNKFDFNVTIEQAGTLSLMLLAISAASVIASIAGKDAKAAIAGIVVLGVMVAAMGALMWGIGELVRGNENIMADLDLAIKVMEKIGLGLGAMIGNLIGGISGGIIDGTLTGIGLGLSNFAYAIQPFLNLMGNIDSKSLDNIKSLAGAIATLTGAKILGAIGFFVGGGNSMVQFAWRLVAMADGLVTFSIKTKNIDQGPHVDFAIGIMEKLIRLADEIPNAGGLLGAIVGNNDMDKFAEQFPKVATGIVSFAYRIKNITRGPHVDYAVEIMKKLAAASKEIPNTGGLLGLLIGDNDMDRFAEQLPIMATGIVSFSYKTKNIDAGKHIDDACDAIAKIAHTSQEIPNTGGLLGAIVGDNDMRPFAEQLPIMGFGILGFTNAIKGIDISDVPLALYAARQISSFSKDLSNSGGLWQDIFGEVSVEEFGRQITWLGKYLYIYSTWIDSIKDFGRFQKSIDAVKMLAEIADIVSGVGKVDFETFGEKLVNYAETSLVSFTQVFKKADTNGIGVKMGETITKGVKSTNLKFVEAASKVMTSFLRALDKKINGMTNSVRSAGKEIADVLLNSAVSRMEWAGNMTTKGFVRGVSAGRNDVVNVGEQLTKSFMSKVQENLGIHSPSKWGEWIGNMTTEGISNGVIEGSSGVIGNITNMWDNVKTLSSEGVQGVKNIIGEKGLWDFSAGIGENLVNAKDKWREILGVEDLNISNMFGFGNIADEIQNQMDEAQSEIQNEFGDFGGDIGSTLGSSIGSSALTSLSDTLKLSMHKHFDYSPFIYLGKQLGDSMAIAANNAIVSKEKTLTDAMSEAISAASEGLEAWQAWAEERKYYSQLSLKDELEGWKAIQNMYEEGTKERMEADKEVYNLQKDLVKETFEYSKNWIDNEKYYNRLSLEEELAAWERVQKRYLEGSEERIEADKQVYSLREELRQKDYENAKKWIEKEKKLEKLSLADELAAYKRILQTTKEGSDEREETEETIFDLQKEIYEAQEQYIEDVKSAQKDAADQRLQLEQEYADKVRQIEEQLASDIESLNDNYMSTLEQRAKTLYGAYGIFDEVTESEADKDQLMQNMEDQVKALSSWKSEINALSKRGLDKKLIDELTEMGPSSAAQIKALNSMTDAELGKYNLLWSQKIGLAREQAIGELEYLRVETADNITQLQQDAAKQLDEYRTTWAEAMKQVTVNCNNTMNQLRKDFGEKVGLIGKDTQKKLNDMVKTSKEILNAAGWDDVGKQIDNGIIKGVQSRKQAVLNAITQLGIDAVKALNKSLEIASPSKATYRSGSFAGEGLVNGLETWRERAYKSGYLLGDEIQNGAVEAVMYLSDLMNNGVSTGVKVTPVLTMDGRIGGLDGFKASLDFSKAVDSALGVEARIDRRQSIEFTNPNEDVVQELHALRSDMARMNEELANMKIVLDTGKVVGGLTGPLDIAFGTKISRNMREKG